MYDWDDSGAALACQWDGPMGNDSHAMRSQEHQRAALREGFAHFLAVLSFENPLNPQGVFKYYKADSDGGGYNFDLFDAYGAGNYPLDYLKNSPWGCACNAAPYLNCAETSTELQWMRGFWRYMSASGTRPTFGQLLAGMQAASLHNCGHECYATVKDSQPTSALRTRFNSVAGTDCYLNTDNWP